MNIITENQDRIVEVPEFLPESVQSYLLTAGNSYNGYLDRLEIYFGRNKRIVLTGKFHELAPVKNKIDNFLLEYSKVN